MRKLLNVMFNKNGNGYTTTRIAIPFEWIKKMNITENNRQVSVDYDEEKKEIRIRKEG